MTTLELIARGVGHNCLSDAYDLGRKDAIDECIKLIGGNMKSVVGVYDNSVPMNDRAYARYIKNEFIEELVKQLEELK